MLNFIISLRSNKIGMTAEVAGRFIKELEAELKSVVQRFREEVRVLRGSRLSTEPVENIKVNYYDEWLTIKELGTLTVVPPREIDIKVWDKTAAPLILKALEDSKSGLTVQSEGDLIRTFLPVLTKERREELGKLVKKISELSRIQVRSRRDEAIKKIKSASDKKEISEDQVFKSKEKIQELVDNANNQIETIVQNKIKELSE
ncbi:MAG: ribosome-recycling factor [Candidatus Liptonbacteria bacterium]|nr:ribosome-recycling factor [Candidatus Liptonbacteria bacterium]